MPSKRTVQQATRLPSNSFTNQASNSWPKISAQQAMQTSSTKLKMTRLCGPKFCSRRKYFAFALSCVALLRAADCQSQLQDAPLQPRANTNSNSQTANSESSKDSSSPLDDLQASASSNQHFETDAESDEPKSGDQLTGQQFAQNSASKIRLAKDLLDSRLAPNFGKYLSNR